MLFNLWSRSTASQLRRRESRMEEMVWPSCGVISPAATDWTTALWALRMSPGAAFCGGSSTWTGRSCGGANRRSMQSFMAMGLPARASSITLLVSSAARSSMRVRASRADWLREKRLWEPRGRPCGLPEAPGRNVPLELRRVVAGLRCGSGGCGLLPVDPASTGGLQAGPGGWTDDGVPASVR